MALMIRKNSGAVTLSLGQTETLKESSNSEREMFLYAILFLHLQNLYTQVQNLSHIMTIVVKTVNMIKNNLLKPQEVETVSSDVLNFLKIHWLSHKKCLE